MILRLMRKDLLLNRSMVAGAAASVVLLVVLLSFGAGTQRSDGVPLEVVIFLATACGSLLASCQPGGTTATGPPASTLRCPSPDARSYSRATCSRCSRCPSGSA